MEAVENRDDQLMAGMSHLSLIVPIFGLIVPLVVWFTQRERSPLLRFQALQAAVYQFIGLAGHFLVVGCQLLIPLMMFPLSLSGELGTNGGFEDLSGDGAVISVGMFIFPLIGYGLLCLIGPIYAILGIAGGVQVLREKDFRYPILGNWIEKKLEAKPEDEDVPEEGN